MSHLLSTSEGVNLEANSGVFKHTDAKRQAPYLSLALSGPAAFTLYLNTDQSTGATLRSMADRLDDYWKDWTAHREREEAARLALEKPATLSLEEALDAAEAAGHLLAKGGTWDARIRVTSNGTATEYRLDRWD